MLGLEAQPQAKRQRAIRTSAIHNALLNVYVIAHQQHNQRGASNGLLQPSSHMQ